MDYDQMVEDLLASFNVSDTLKAELREKTELLGLYTAKLLTTGDVGRQKANLQQITSQIAALVGIAEAEVRDKVQQQVILMAGKLIAAALA